MTEIICTVCPRGCRMKVDGETVTGNSCPRGAEYGRNEAAHPVRVLTATVALRHKLLHRLPVRTSCAIPRELLSQGMKELEGFQVCPPVRAGQVLIRNFLGTSADLIACRTISDEEELL